MVYAACRRVNEKGAGWPKCWPPAGGHPHLDRAAIDRLTDPANTRRRAAMVDARSGAVGLPPMPADHPKPCP